MNNYCLSTDELHDFLNNILFDAAIDNDYLLRILEAAKNWEAQSSGLSYFLGRIVQRKLNKDSLEPDYISSAYKVNERVFFNVLDIDSNFIDYLLMHDRLLDYDYTLDEILILLQSSFLENDYGRVVRS